MIGNRLKLLRLANALSLQDLANMIEKSGLFIGKATLSNYENGLTFPSEQALSTISKILGTSRDFFDQPDWEDFEIIEYTEYQETPKKIKTSTIAYLQMELEKYAMVDKITGHKNVFNLPSKTSIDYENEDAVEQIADDFRKKSELGSMPISSVCCALEACGWKLIEMQGGSPYICGFERSRGFGFVLYPALFAIDDFRFEILKAIGYSMIEGQDPSHTDILTDRFASAVLVPKNAAFREFGNELREKISTFELGIIKQKYGISRRVLKQRLLDLKIITEDCFLELESALRMGGYPRRKQIVTENLKFYECPTILKQRILEATDKGLITKEKAAPYLE